MTDGKRLAQEILSDVRRERRKIKKPIRLVAVLVGGDPGSIHFLRQKEKACRDVGVDFSLRRYPASISGSRLRREVRAVVKNPNTTGVIVQLPLPKKLGDPMAILSSIPWQKDVDVIGSEAFGAFVLGDQYILPPVVGAAKYILEKYRVKVRGKYVVVVGAGHLVGKPAAVWFMNQGATVTVLNEWTKDIAQYICRADILVSGVGKPGLIRANMVKRGAVVLDAGYAVKNGKPFGRAQGKPSGDVDFKGVSKKAKLITPVPGGIGPMTVALLLSNLVKLAERH